jgi:hypothetical protein
MIGQLPATDRGRRLSDAVREARAAGAEGWWIAARLSDGGTDTKVYPSKEDAVKWQLHETQCAYLQLPPMDMPPAEAEGWLALHERAYEAGMRLSDPGAPQPILGVRPDRTPNNRAERRAAARGRRP